MGWQIDRSTKVVEHRTLKYQTMGGNGLTGRHEYGS